jgi:hydroxymethylpyrimidine pyrophosphatase-like HAD family hydrolase
MFRSVLPYAEAAGIEAPLVCYQGAAVVDPVTREWLLHEPIPLALAQEAIEAVQDAGFALNCYVDDDLFVARVTENARSYADFQSLPLHEVGDLVSWIERPPTISSCSSGPATASRSSAATRRCSPSPTGRARDRARREWLRCWRHT